MVPSWVDVQKIPAKVQIGSGREFFGAKRINAELDGLVQIRQSGRYDLELHVKKVV
jgi:head-tail adaptor